MKLLKKKSQLDLGDNGDLQTILNSNEKDSHQEKKVQFQFNRPFVAQN
jgi:hypothetical protein